MSCVNAKNVLLYKGTRLLLKPDSLFNSQIKTCSAGFMCPLTVLPKTAHSNRPSGADTTQAASVFIPAAGELSGYFELLMLSTGH